VNWPLKSALPSVSLELLIRLLLATGATPQDIGQIIAGMKGVAESSSEC
jgi:hypothetical protein